MKISNIDSIVFYRVNDKYVSMITQKESDKKSYPISIFSGKDIFNESDFIDFSFYEIIKGKKWRKFENNEFIILTPIVAPIAVMSRDLFLTRRKERWPIDILVHSENIIKSKKFDLLYNILIKITSRRNLNECVSLIAQQYYFDAYSFWKYNKLTSTFTCEVSSRDVNCQAGYICIINKPTNQLSEFINSGKCIDTRELSKDCHNYNYFSDMQTINRIKIPLGEAINDKGEVGVLNLFSKYSDFSLSDTEYETIVNIINLVLREEQKDEIALLQELENVFINKYSFGNLQEILFKIVVAVCDKIKFETCAIFLEDEKQEKLQLVALKDSQTNGKPNKNYQCYLRNDVSKTVNTWIKGMAHFSYDLKSTPSKLPVESTVSDEKNCLGLPIKSDDRSVGVLRVKNKINNNGNVVHFSPSDSRILEWVCSSIAHFYKIETRYKELDDKVKKTGADYHLLQDFIKAFTHEVRTPVSIFCTAPEMIKHRLNGYNIADNDKIFKYLTDIHVLGERLLYISKIYTIDQLWESYKCEKLSLQTKLIYPIYNLSKYYYLETKGIEFICNPNDFANVYIFGDINLLGIALNALIDNAAKYSQDVSRKYFILSRNKSHHNVVEIVISNYGFPIQKNERNLIFDKNYRGSLAKMRKISGSGIGLYLSKEIIVKHKGELILASAENPVSFVIRLPLAHEG